MSTQIVFPTSSAPGTKPQESGGRLVNAFVEKTLVGAPAQIMVRRSPGLQRTTFGDGVHFHTRGFLDAGSVALWIVDDRVLKFDGNFVVVDVGALTGADLVTVARNNALVRQNVVVTSLGAFNLFDSSPPTAFTGAPGLGLPASPTSVCDYEGYFIFSFGDGSIFASDLNMGNVDPDSFNKEQGLFVRRVVRYAGRLYAFGDKWTGVYNNAGTVPFPLVREVTIPRGIVSTHAVAGWETGWANNLIWVGDDFVVYRLDGYTPTPVSTDDVSRAVQTAVLAGDRDLIQAFVYMYGKNAFWVLTCPGHWTWEYNFITGEWNERLSFNQINWKGSQSLRMFDRWLIGDQYSGELYVISGSYFLEGNDPLIWQVESGVLAAFPQSLYVSRASFHITAGVGDFMSVSDPRVEISWSRDGGYSYGSPVLRKLGMPGNTNSHPYVLGCGISRGQGFRYRLRVSDPVHVGLSGGTVEAEPRAFSG